MTKKPSSFSGSLAVAVRLFTIADLTIVENPEPNRNVGVEQSMRSITLAGKTTQQMELKPERVTGPREVANRMDSEKPVTFTVIEN